MSRKKIEKLTCSNCGVKFDGSAFQRWSFKCGKTKNPACGPKCQYEFRIKSERNNKK